MSRISMHRIHWVLNRVALDEAVRISTQFPKSTRANLNVQIRRNVVQLDEQSQKDPSTKKWVTEQTKFVDKYGWNCWLNNI